MTTLREKLIKTGAKVVTHSGYVIFQIAEVAVPRHMKWDPNNAAAVMNPVVLRESGQWNQWWNRLAA